MLRLKTKADASTGIAAKRGAACRRGSADASSQRRRRRATLRYVSLPRLEREIARRQAAHEPLDAGDAHARRVAARAIRVRVSGVGRPGAGRAGRRLEGRRDGRIVSTDTREPVVRLDDLLVLLRRGRTRPTAISAARSIRGRKRSPRRRRFSHRRARSRSSRAAEEMARAICAIRSASRISRSSASTRRAAWQRAGRGRLSHEAGRHGTGRRRGRRRKLFEVDPPAAGRVAAGDVGAAVVVRAQLRIDRAIARRTMRSSSSARACAC